jgi:hypothetical protein
MCRVSADVTQVSQEQTVAAPVQRVRRVPSRMLQCLCLVSSVQCQTPLLLRRLLIAKRVPPARVSVLLARRLHIHQN